jgi:hypothetical protein
MSNLNRVETKTNKSSEQATIPAAPVTLPGDFAEGERTMPPAPEGPDFARGERTQPPALEGPDFARGERATALVREGPDFARGQRIAPKNEAASSGQK